MASTGSSYNTWRSARIDANQLSSKSVYIKDSTTHPKSIQCYSDTEQTAEISLYLIYHIFVELHLFLADSYQTFIEWFQPIWRPVLAIVSHG